VFLTCTGRFSSGLRACHGGLPVLGELESVGLSISIGATLPIGTPRFGSSVPITRSPRKAKPCGDQTWQASFLVWRRTGWQWCVSVGSTLQLVGMLSPYPSYSSTTAQGVFSVSSCCSGAANRWRINQGKASMQVRTASMSTYLTSDLVFIFRVGPFPQRNERTNGQWQPHWHCSPIGWCLPIRDRSSLHSGASLRLLCN